MHYLDRRLVVRTAGLFRAALTLWISSLADGEPLLSGPALQVGCCRRQDISYRHVNTPSAIHSNTETWQAYTLSCFIQNVFTLDVIMWNSIPQCYTRAHRYKSLQGIAESVNNNHKPQIQPEGWESNNLEIICIINTTHCILFPYTVIIASVHTSL